MNTIKNFFKRNKYTVTSVAMSWFGTFTLAVTEAPSYLWFIAGLLVGVMVVIGSIEDEDYD